MIVSEERGNTVRVPEGGWRFDCDAVDCQRNITIYKDGRVLDSSTFGSIWTVSDFDDSAAVSYFTDAETAFDLVADEFGWQRGTLGVQRGHHYCALHSEAPDACLWMM